MHSGVPPTTGQLDVSMPNLESPATHLRLDHVTKKFGAFVAVDRVSLDIARGSFTTLLGPSGCGKTTLLRMIAGFYEPDEGGILLNEQRIDQMPAHKRGTAMVFQDYALWPHMTVFDNIAYGLRRRHVKDDEIRARVIQTMELVEMPAPEMLPRRPNELSGGQQQRVALARARSSCSRRRSCSTSRCRTSTPKCANVCASNCGVCKNGSTSRRST